MVRLADVGVALAAAEPLGDFLGRLRLTDAGVFSVVAASAAAAASDETWRGEWQTLSRCASASSSSIMRFCNSCRTKMAMKSISILQKEITVEKHGQRRQSTPEMAGWRKSIS